MTATDGGLTAEQSHVLFDVLTHRATYSEIEAFKTPGTIHKYGPPFQDIQSSTTSPILQTLVSKFILKLPGLRDVAPTFWKVQVEDLIQELSEAELSESYDKGLLGVRKTLATAISALIEYPARGCLAGVPRREVKRKEYDVTNPEDVLQAWQDCLQAVVYGDLIDDLFRKAAETDDLKQHDTLVQGMHEFMVVNIASLMHYTLVLSPEGPTLLRMIENVHRLIPYTVVRQTLKIGNVASMISAMMRVILAKVSMGSVTNWMGLSSGADEGMNLLEQIISQVLSWDKRDLKNRAEKIEKDKNAPPKAVRNELTEWIKNRSREEHEECRRMSREQSMSIVAVILSLSSNASVDDLTETQHAKALEWLSLRLAIRDRQEIVRVLCHRNPDHLTVMVNEAVSAYTPLIRQVHQAVNLSDTAWDFERFVTDMLKMSKSTAAQKGEAPKPPSVEDYVDLLHRHQQSTHKFLHQIAKNGKEVMSWWQEYVHTAAAEFRMSEKPPPSEAVVSQKGSGDIHAALADTFSTLSSEDKEAVQAELAAHSTYLNQLHAASAARISAVIKREGSTPYGPGAYLARWQNLLDSTRITPATANGPVRWGASKSVREEGRKDIEGNQVGLVSEEEVEKVVDKKIPDAPPVEKTLELFGKRFREALAGG